MAHADNRILRIIVGSLLASSLSDRELILVSERLLVDKRWARRLAFMLRELPRITRSAGLGRGLDPDTVSFDACVEETLDLFKQKRWPKRKALDLLRHLNPARSWKPDPTRTLRENVNQLLGQFSSAREASGFVHTLAQHLGYQRDPYLHNLLRQ